jgi:hypothetical protein
LYIALGVTYRIKVHEIKGVEALPNIDFWREFPFLVQDGLVYSMKKLRQWHKNMKVSYYGNGYDDL